MNSTQWLTVLGVVAGASELAISKNIYPEYASWAFLFKKSYSYKTQSQNAMGK
jgi:hypothetical protein